MFKGTPNTNGRPKGSSNKLTTETRKIIFNAIKEGEEAFLERLGALQNRDFVKYYLEMLRLIVPTPKEIFNHEETEQKEITITYVSAADEIKRLEALESKFNVTDNDT